MCTSRSPVDHGLFASAKKKGFQDWGCCPRDICEYLDLDIGTQDRFSNGDIARSNILYGIAQASQLTRLSPISANFFFLHSIPSSELSTSDSRYLSYRRTTFYSESVRSRRSGTSRIKKLRKICGQKTFILHLSLAAAARSIEKRRRRGGGESQWLSHSVALHGSRCHAHGI